MKKKDEEERRKTKQIKERTKETDEDGEKGTARET